MNKEFIPYEQALELKELGFNEECFGCYELAEVRDYKNNGLEIRNEIVLNTLNGYRKYDDESQTCAPTFSQAFRWFREKKILVEIKAIDDWNSWGFKIFEEDCMSPFYMSYYDYDDLNEYHTYEEAELACLKKLIETAKKYKN